MERQLNADMTGYRTVETLLELALSCEQASFNA